MKADSAHCTRGVPAEDRLLADNDCKDWRKLEVVTVMQLYI